MMEKLLIKNIRIPDPDTRKIQIADILLARSKSREEGRIIEISETIQAEDARVMDGEGGYLLPCFCDIASDFCQPGYEYRETIETGSLSAFYGGYSHVMLTPDTKPFADSASVLEDIDRISKATARCHILKCGALTKSGRGLELCDYDKLSGNGALCFSDGNFPRHDMRLLRLAMLECAGKDHMIMLTPVRDPLYPDSTMTCGSAARLLSAPAEPPSSEARTVASYLILAEETGCRIHLRNISTAASVEAVRAAKQKGIRVSASTSPMYFSFTDNDTVFIGSNAKVYPPLRSQSDRDAVIRGLVDSTIDCIESSHIPLSLMEKAGGMESARFGAIGLQTVFGCAVTYLLSAGHIDIYRLIDLLSVQPRRILGLTPVNKVDKDCNAFVLCDMSKEIILTSSYLKGRSTNCPYIGMSLCGEVVKTFIL